MPMENRSFTEEKEACPHPVPKMRIAMIGHKRVPSREGGVEIVVEELATRMARTGHDVTLYNRRMHTFLPFCCLFCEPGKGYIVKAFCERILRVEAIILTVDRFRFLCGGRQKLITRTLPGYLFLYFDDGIDIHRIIQIEHLFRVLSMTGEYGLFKRNLKFAQWIYDPGGTVKTSQAYLHRLNMITIIGVICILAGIIRAIKSVSMLYILESEV